MDTDEKCFRVDISAQRIKDDPGLTKTTGPQWQTPRGARRCMNTTTVGPTGRRTLRAMGGVGGPGLGVLSETDETPATCGASLSTFGIQHAFVRRAVVDLLDRQQRPLRWRGACLLRASRSLWVSCRARVRSMADPGR